MRPAPKEIRANIAYRKAILKRAQGDKAFQHECWIRCARDPIFFINVFCWTYDPKKKTAPHRPFILYDYQEPTVHQIVKATGVHNLLAEKSRQMGFTWLVCAVRLWFWIFWPGLSFLFGSRKEELVDSPGNPIALFWKLDYMLAHLPNWMRPHFVRTERHLLNEDNGTTIDGESTNRNFARGGTKTAIDLDEFSAVDSAGVNGYDIIRAVNDATDSCLFFGTSQGAFGAYYDLLQKMRAEHPERIIRWHWSEHPDKRIGLYTTETGEAGGPLKILDTEYWSTHDQSAYKFILDGRLRSIAYDEKDRNCPNPMIMAQEWDLDYFAAACQWFDQKMLDRLKADTRPPVHVGEIVFDPDWRNPRWFEKARGSVELWFDWPEEKGLIPKEWNDIGAGSDVSMGKGGEMSSNSVTSFARRTTGEKIAQFTTGTMDPKEFCHHTLALCRWFNDAYLAWEENGPGQIFTVAVRDAGYRNVFMREDSETKFVSKKTMKPGWYSSKETKRLLLAAYADALMDGSYKNPSKPAIEECGQYIQEPNGEVHHAKSTATEDPSAAGESHGDMVISDALANRAIQDLTRREIEKPAPKPGPKPNSFAGRWEAYQNRQQDQPYRWGSFARS